jgi:hypothetical protein
MAHTIRHEVSGSPQKAARRAKALPLPGPAPAAEVTPDKRPTWRPPRLSEPRVAVERPRRKETD